MKNRCMTMILVLVTGILCSATYSHGSILTGSDDFEAYPTGAWNPTTAPEANPSTWYNGENAAAIAANIVDDGGTNQELQLDINLQNSWQVGALFELSCSNNASIYIKDYSMDFYLRIPPASVSNLTAASSLILSIRDPNNTLRGSAYSIASYDPGYTNAQSGTVITIPLGAGGLAVGATAPMDGSVTNWQIEFRIDSNHSASNQPIVIAIDDMAVTYTEPPFLNTTWAPVGLTTNDPVVSATVHDGTKEVDTMILYLDGGVVVSNSYAGGSTSNTVSYSWIGAPGGTHTGAVVAVAADAYAETNTWTFQIPVPPPPPATNILQLFSFNIEGSNPGDPYLNPPPLDKHSVTNGTLGAAPSLGSNVWNNLMFVNAWYIWDPWNWTLTDASGDTNTVCWFQISQDNAVGSYINTPWNWNGEVNDFVSGTDTAGTMWPVWLGETVTDLDLFFDGLDPNATYDLYMYFTSPNSANTGTTTYSVVAGSAPTPVATLVSSWDPLLPISGGSPTNYVEGVNYAVITMVSPNAGGRITLNISGGSKAGICAMQVAMRDDGGSGGPTVPPTIQSMTMAGGMATLMFDSESGFTYTVSRKTSLMDESWTPVTNVTGVGAVTEATVPAGSDEEFYQVMGE